MSTQTLAIDVSVSAEWKRASRAPAAVCSRAAAAAFKAVPKSRKPKARDVELAVVLTSDAAVKRLNATYRGKNKPTDVLSFPAWLGGDANDGPAGDARGAILGDVVVAKGVSGRDAKAERKTLDEHLAHLVVHGVLHLLGYDHENDADARAMERLEISVLKSLGIPDPYLAREPRRATQRAGAKAAAKKPVLKKRAKGKSGRR